jgi:hypothetical protein
LAKKSNPFASGALNEEVKMREVKIGQKASGVGTSLNHHSVYANVDLLNLDASGPVAN